MSFQLLTISCQPDPHFPQDFMFPIPNRIKKILLLLDFWWIRHGSFTSIAPILMCRWMVTTWCWSRKFEFFKRKAWNEQNVYVLKSFVVWRIFQSNIGAPLLDVWWWKSDEFQTFTSEIISKMNIARWIIRLKILHDS